MNTSVLTACYCVMCITFKLLYKDGIDLRQVSVHVVLLTMVKQTVHGLFLVQIVKNILNSS